MADRVEDYAKLPVVFLLQLVESPVQFCVRGEQFAEADEGSHDLDIHGDGPLAAEHAGEHRHALFGEGVGRPPQAHFDRRIGGHKL